VKPGSESALGFARVVATSLALVAPSAFAQPALPVDAIKLPPGFAIEVLARVPNARAMTWGATGTLFVGSAPEGKVYAVTLPPAGTKGEASVQVIASGLREPAGVAFRDRALARFRDFASSPLRRHRASSRRSARAGRRQRPLSH
jgi:hypothetical protein